VHKARNILDRLPRHLHAPTRRALRQPGAGSEEGGEAAGGFEFVDATEGGDDVLSMDAVFAAVLDDLQIGAGA
jgi:hypothetical protein